MKKKIIALICAAACLVTCFALPASASAATTMTLNRTSININSGNSTTITVKINGKTKSAKEFTWYNNNKNTISLSLGKVTARKLGSATVTAVYKKNKRIRKTCSVRVFANYTVSASSNPFHNKFTNYGSTYNKYTKQYYMIRSYLEQINFAGGGTLTLKKGTYTIPCTLYVPSKITIKLLDGVAIKKSSYTGTNKITASQSMFQFVSPSQTSTKFTEYNGAHDIKILGTGNASIDLSKAVAGKESTSIVMGHNKNIVIDNVLFKNLKYGHFIEMDASKNVTVSNCRFYNNDSIINDIVAGKSKTGGGSVNLDTPDAKTKGFTQPWTSYDCTANTDVVFSGCKFNNVDYAIETHQYSQDKFHTNVTIQNCSFSNINKYAIQLMNWQSPIIENNTFTNIAVGKTADSNAAYPCAIVASGVTTPTIAGNKFSYCKNVFKFKSEQEDKYGYDRIYNDIDEATYRQIGATNYSVGNNLNTEVVVSEGFDSSGKPLATHIYRDIFIATL